MAQQTVRDYLECPCCGDTGKESDADGYFYDGDDLDCGCPGWVSCDRETPPWINSGDDYCTHCYGPWAAHIQSIVDDVIRATGERGDHDSLVPQVQIIESNSSGGDITVIYRNRTIAVEPHWTDPAIRDHIRGLLELSPTSAVVNRT